MNTKWGTSLRECCASWGGKFHRNKISINYFENLKQAVPFLKKGPHIVWPSGEEMSDKDNSLILN